GSNPLAPTIFPLRNQSLPNPPVSNAYRDFGTNRHQSAHFGTVSPEIVPNDVPPAFCAVPACEVELYLALGWRLGPQPDGDVVPMRPPEAVR
ncbi:MAG: hypothetical protein R3D51_19420, partial [Hyphomicrobiaceae bacterium]